MKFNQIFRIAFITLGISSFMAPPAQAQMCMSIPGCKITEITIKTVRYKDGSTETTTTCTYKCS